MSRHRQASRSTKAHIKAAKNHLFLLLATSLTPLRSVYIHRNNVHRSVKPEDDKHHQVHVTECPLQRVKPTFAWFPHLI